MSNHRCAGRTCLFCKALDNQRWERKEAKTKARPDLAIYKRALEVAQTDQIEASRRTFAANNLEEMETYVLLDKQTGLCNSRTLERELSQEIQRSQRLKRQVSLCMITIEGLEDSARQHGSLAADSILRTVASTIKKAIREIDTAGRWGADKFAVILPETNTQGAQVVSERIRRRISAELSSALGPNRSMVVSVAIATYPNHARKSDELLDQAAKALNFAVIQGGNCVVQATLMH